jgi:hypothetical protein
LVFFQARPRVLSHHCRFKYSLQKGIREEGGRLSLRDEIAKLLNAYAPWNTTGLLDAILALIDAQRCVWKKDSDGAWLTSCQWAWLPSDMEYTFCPCCGKRIEIKEEAHP